VAVGDKIEPGDHWNTTSVGEKTDGNANFKRGTVVEVKTWADDERDWIVVLWEDMVPSGRNGIRARRNSSDGVS
jgi:hypothetical protein